MNIKKFQILLHPLFIISLMLLIINDHYLKANYPSMLTGKISDFAGLFVFAIFIFAIGYSFFSRRFNLIYLHITIALFFILWKLAPVEILLNSISKITSLPMPTRVKDPTDLVALSILIISYMFITSRLKTVILLNISVYKKLLISIVLVVSGWSIMATTDCAVCPDDEDEYDGYFTCCKGMRGNIDGSDNDSLNIADLTYLVTYLYENGPRPPCLEEADVDASGDKNPVREDDLIYLTDYIFDGGPPPCDCPREAGYE